MLLRFTLNNFLSFNSEQEFSMNAGKATTHDERITKFPEQSILKFSALYGANASGKSNFVKAINFSRSIILKGIKNLNSTEYHYKLKPENMNKPTKFEYDLKIGDKYYGYGFSVKIKEKKILKEWLVELQPKQDKLIFERETADNYKNHDINFKNPEEASKFDVQIELANDIENTLLITEISRKKNNPEELKILEAVYNWFKNELVIIYPHSKLTDFTNIFKKSDEQLVKLLEYFDTGICGYELKPSSLEQIQKYMPKQLYDIIINDLEEEKNVQNKTKDITHKTGKGILNLNNHFFVIEFNKDETKIYELLFKHNDSNISFTLGEESDGTKRLIELLDIIYDNSKQRTVLIDELDRSLHPQMTIKFVKTFLEYSKKLNTQLIITTHESNLMDLKILRRDEIWFVERDSKNNESQLYSLEKFKVHNTKKIDKAYLEGRYGAVPIFKDFESYLGESNEDTKI